MSYTEFTRTISSIVRMGEPCTESVPALLGAAHYAMGDPAPDIALCANCRGDTDTTAARARYIRGAHRGLARPSRGLALARRPFEQSGT